MGVRDNLAGSVVAATMNYNEFNFEVPLTLTISETFYNPSNFTSTRMGYIMTNTGSSINFAGTGVGINSGQLSIPAGSWNIIIMNGF